MRVAARPCSRWFENHALGTHFSNLLTAVHGFQEIDRLNEENSRLRSKLGMAQDQASGAQQDRHALEAEMLKTKKMLDAAKSGRVVSGATASNIE